MTWLMGCPPISQQSATVSACESGPCPHRYHGTSTCLSRLSLIVVVEAPNFRHGEHSTPFWRLYWASFRAIHLQRQVRTPGVVIGKVVRDDAPEVALTQDDHVV